MAVHHAVGISHERNSGYRPSRVNIVAQGLYTPDPSLSPTHLSIRRGRATTTHYTHQQVSLVVSCNTTLVPSLGLRIGPACEAGLSAGMRRERVSPQIRKKGRKDTKETMKLGVTKRSVQEIYPPLFFTGHRLSPPCIEIEVPACGCIGLIRSLIHQEMVAQ